METKYRPLSGAIRQFIRERGKTSSSFATEIGSDRSHFSRVLNGHASMTWEFGHRIAVGLGVPDDAVMEPIRQIEAVAS